MSLVAEYLYKGVLAIGILKVLISYYNILVFFCSVFHCADLFIPFISCYLRMAAGLELNLSGDFSFLQFLY